MGRRFLFGRFLVAVPAVLFHTGVLIRPLLFRRHGSRRLIRLFRQLRLPAAAPFPGLLLSTVIRFLSAGLVLPESRRFPSGRLGEGFCLLAFIRLLPVGLRFS